jgi:L-2,4-diaminobutyrate decarboxylase
MHQPPYTSLLACLRRTFQQPISDRVHDSYVVHSIMRALDRVDQMKSDLPMLGRSIPADYVAAQTASLGPKTRSLEEVIHLLVGYLEGMTNYGHPRTQQNVIPQPTIPSVIGVLLASLYNPNLAWDEYSRRVALAEVEVAAITAGLVGYDQSCSAGLFTFGGTGTNLYGAKIGLEKACPGSMIQGVKEPAVILASGASHYCRYTVAGWLGLGTNALITAPSTNANEVDLDDLARAARRALEEGKKLAAFIVTLGTTDAFGLDDLAGVVALRDELVCEFNLPYRPHIHGDAVIGWAWSVFNDYDIEANQHGFRRRTIRALAGARRRIQHLHLADSIGIDFHKTGFAPYTSSLFLVKDRSDLNLLGRSPEQMPYLFQYGEHKPGVVTLETSRAGTGILAALANLRLFGKEGMQVILGHLVEMAQLLREHLEGHTTTLVLNRDNFGTVTLFRVYPPGVDTFAIRDQEFDNPGFRDVLHRHNEYNRRIFRYVYDEAMAGRGVVLSMTDCYRYTCYGEPIVGLKSYILSPFVDAEHVEAVVTKIIEAQQHVSLDAGAEGEPVLAK